MNRASIARILETGLGGRLDSTNVVRPAVTCITTIEREHTARLGNEIPGIAREKAGIVKAGVPLVLGRVPREAERVIRERAGEMEGRRCSGSTRNSERSS